MGWRLGVEQSVLKSNLEEWGGGGCKCCIVGLGAPSMGKVMFFSEGNKLKSLGRGRASVGWLGAELDR